jgi:hypothetical protein
MTLATRPYHRGPLCAVAITHGRVQLRTSMPTMAYAIAYYDPFVSRGFTPPGMVLSLIAL